MQLASNGSDENYPRTAVGGRDDGNGERMPGRIEPRIAERPLLLTPPSFVMSMYFSISSSIGRMDLLMVASLAARDIAAEQQGQELR
ncbi:hypothetical protein E2562_010461 [Oryza meyeriana var. granulata]|uniref:Uncharacterized protein n=1 Tax=Oryza meyeriana var. granulata TaxID=110450 RepID=A0A6G1F6Z4_9ORYZ|nr:hypothetical protein E2562_010461 [Oryza meyeriana var. granulata]